MNLASLKKNQLLWLITNKCKHGMSYITHPACYEKDYPLTLPGDIPEKICFLDTENSNLHADFGYVFSYAIKPLDGPITGRVLTSSEIRNFIFDKVLMAEFCKEIKKFDRIVVHYGTDFRFDIPFLRTRCVKYGLPFPLHKEISAEDTFAMSRAKLRLSRNRLENICDFLEVPSKQHKMQPTIWQKALAGHSPSLEYIWKHNKEDVVSLEAVWKKLNPYVARTKRSL